MFSKSIYGPKITLGFEFFVRRGILAWLAIVRFEYIGFRVTIVNLLSRAGLSPKNLVV